jgi:hypothetical protein
MKRISATIALCLVVALLSAAWPTPALAQDGGYVVQIRAGSCDDPGDALAQLDDLPAVGGASIGSEGAAIAVSAYSVAPVSLDALTGSATALFVLDPASGGIVACGEVGGVVDSNGALSIGLRPGNDSGFSGIAYLAPAAGGQTGISTFLAQTGGSGEAAEPDATTMEPEAYGSMVRNQITIVVGSLQRINTLFDSPQAGDSGWESQVVAELFLWRLIYGVAGEAAPPDELASFHERYLDALSLLDGAALDVNQWLNTNDEESLDQGNTKIQEAVQALQALDTPDTEGTPSASGDD